MAAVNAISPERDTGKPGVKARLEPTLKVGVSMDRDGDNAAEVATAIGHLRHCARELDEAMREEGIDPHGPLGIWSRAAQRFVITFAVITEAASTRIEGRLEIIEAAMRVEVERVKVAVEQSRAETARARVSIAQSEEVRRLENLKLARELGAEITQTIKTTALAREIRFNRRQNWSAVALVSGVLIAVFIAGGAWSGFRHERSILDQCIANQLPDGTGKTYWCPMPVVRGGL